MEIIEYDSKYKQDFIDFNTAWIVDNFGFLEPEDKETFDKIDEELSKGNYSVAPSKANIGVP